MPPPIFSPPASLAPRRISRARWRIWIGRLRSHPNGKYFSKRLERLTALVFGLRRARRGAQSWTSFLIVRRRRQWWDDWHGGMETTPPPSPCSTAQSAVPLPHLSGSTSVSPARIYVITLEPPRPTAGHSK